MNNGEESSLMTTQFIYGREYMIWTMKTEEIVDELEKAKKRFQQSYDLEPDLILTSPKWEGIGTHTRSWVDMFTIFVSSSKSNRLPYPKESNYPKPKRQYKKRNKGFNDYES